MIYLFVLFGHCPSLEQLQRNILLAITIINIRFKNKNKMHGEFFTNNLIVYIEKNNVSNFF